LNGALETIAITGVEGASAQRIARAAGYGFSTAYSYFKSKEELAEEAIQMVMTQLFTLDRDSDLIHDHDGYIRRITAFVRGGLSEEGRLVRQLRVECVVAARHSARIRQFAQGRFNEVLVHALHRNSGRHDGEFSMVATWAVVATHNFAFPLVAGCTRYLDGIDWTPMAEQLYLVRNNFKA
ncbi:MAG: TetR/AcrR family transcriptional regulator, partial [Actinobacteria bacterium]|nr:TetR/AcrR family transcriptional regulator [Actinomycetota bacterium]